MESIAFDEKKVLLKKYKLRTAGAQGATIEITLPKEALEREARRLDVSEEQAVEKLMGVWKYNSFKGLHLDFELKTPEERRHTCSECGHWAGRCLKNKVGKIASDVTCDSFELKNSVKVQQ